MCVSVSREKNKSAANFKQEKPCNCSSLCLSLLGLSVRHFLLGSLLLSSFSLLYYVMFARRQQQQTQKQKECLFENEIYAEECCVHVKQLFFNVFSNHVTFLSSVLA